MQESKTMGEIDLVRLGTKEDINV